MKKKLTLEEIQAMDREMLTPGMIAGVMGCNPYYITVQARKDPSKLGFPVSLHGNRTLIPRRAFLKFMGAD